MPSTRSPAVTNRPTASAPTSARRWRTSSPVPTVSPASVGWPVRAKARPWSNWQPRSVTEGYDSVFCAPTASAAATLRKEVSYLGKTMTLQKLLADPNVQARLSPGSVMVLDEAGAVGLDDMAKLFEIARRNNCRVILSGDTGQHSSVPRGDALRIIEQYSSYRFSELTTIRRQKPAAFRQIVELAAAKQTDKAFAKLVELGAVTEVRRTG